MAFLSLDDRRKIGIGLTAFGVLFTAMGVMFFFDKGLIAMGNVLFLSGVATLMGFVATLKFFARPTNLKGTAVFAGGLGLVIWGWALIGLVIELYGFFLLFRAFIPTALMFARRVPGVGFLLDLPWLRRAFDSLSGGGKLPV